MEHKVNDIITYNHNGETIYLKVIEDLDCKNCFFYSTACCSNIRNDIGDCLNIRRSDKTPIIFKKVTNKTMNENIDLTKILKNCPKGTKFYTPVWGEVVFIEVKKDENCLYPICIDTNSASSYTSLAKDGRYITNREETECILFPSKEQRDWSKFTAPWYKTEKFDTKTLKPFDRVLVRFDDNERWCCNFFSHINEENNYPFETTSTAYRNCIPYNDETKHLVGTKDEAPDYYRYWED